MKNKIFINISEEDYFRFVKSGMFWEFFPNATGNYQDDVLITSERELFSFNIIHKP